MNDINTGGPAFPVFPETGGGHAAAFQGMTLRDYFAALAMQAMMRNQKTRVEAGDVSSLAVNAYDIADAMLEARKEQT
jgi:hypothetical protein